MTALADLRAARQLARLASERANAADNEARRLGDEARAADDKAREAARRLWELCSDKADSSDPIRPPSRGREFI